MELNTTHAPTQPHSAPTSLLPQKSRLLPHTPPFLQALADAVQNTASDQYTAQPACLGSLPKQRSHLDLTSLNPVQPHYTPEPAALERIGTSRISQVVLGST